MSFAAILGRRLDVPVINLGFSGNGKAENEIAELLGELDASVFVLDPLPNLFASQVDERLPTFIQTLRKLRPTTPILLNESPRFPAIAFVPGQMQRMTDSNNILQLIGKAQEAAGDHHIAVITGADLAAGSGETTVDGLHPTDIGFVIMADAIEPALRKAMN
jgi:lysophospholipase L1-like esterase